MEKFSIDDQWLEEYQNKELRDIFIKLIENNERIANELLPVDIEEGFQEIELADGQKESIEVHNGFISWNIVKIMNLDPKDLWFGVFTMPKEDPFNKEKWNFWFFAITIQPEYEYDKYQMDLLDNDDADLFLFSCDLSELKYLTLFFELKEANIVLKNERLRLLVETPQLQETEIGQRVMALYAMMLESKQVRRDNINRFLKQSDAQ